jgi:hypothetical protein
MSQKGRLPACSRPFCFLAETPSQNPKRSAGQSHEHNEPQGSKVLKGQGFRRAEIEVEIAVALAAEGGFSDFKAILRAEAVPFQGESPKRLVFMQLP